MFKKIIFMLLIIVGMGVLGFIIFSFSLSSYYAAIMGVFVGILFLVILGISMTITGIKNKRIIAGIDQRILLKSTTTMYDEGAVTSGVLFLSEHKLYFYQSGKPMSKYEYTFEEIDDIYFGTFQRYIKGFTVSLRNGNDLKIVMSENEFAKWIEEIGKLSGRRYDIQL